MAEDVLAERLARKSRRQEGAHDDEGEKHKNAKTVRKTTGGEKHKKAATTEPEPKMEPKPETEPKHPSHGTRRM